MFTFILMGPALDYFCVPKIFSLILSFELGMEPRFVINVVGSKSGTQGEIALNNISI